MSTRKPTVEDPDTEEKIRQSGPPAEGSPLPPDPIKLLFVDDEKGFADVMAKRLSKRGIDVTKAYSGTEALQVLRKADFDVAVLDLKMEDVNGIEVLKIFKKMVPDLSVIMLTGHGSEEAAREGIRLGANDYLNKPYDFEELVKKIRETDKGGR